MSYEIVNEKYFTIKINKNFHNKTLEELFKYFNISNQKKYYLYNNKCCFINGEILDKDSILKYNDYLMIDQSNFEKLDYLPLNKELEVLYEDDYILIVNKPSGYIIYPDSKEKNNTMANIVSNYYISTNQDLTVRHCHRLDIDTTGALIYAKDIFTHGYLSKLFEEHKIEKTYLAIVEASLNKETVITTPIGKDRHISGKMITTKNGQPAYTKFKVLKYAPKLSFVKINIKTGRTHQIRVHMSSIGAPLYGDTLYGSVNTSRIMLHCYHLKFIHPITLDIMDIVAKIPKDFDKLLKKESLHCENKRNLL